MMRRRRLGPLQVPSETTSEPQHDAWHRSGEAAATFVVGLDRQLGHDFPRELVAAPQILVVCVDRDLEESVQQLPLTRREFAAFPGVLDPLWLLF